MRATVINEEMKIAAVRAIAELAREEVPADVLAACDLQSLAYGADYIIPKPMDSRLLPRVAGAVASAAVDSGVAELPLPEAYRAAL